MSIFKHTAWSNQKGVVLANTVLTKPTKVVTKKPSVKPPQIIEQNVIGQANYYPEKKMSARTTNVLLTMAGIFLAAGLNLLEPKFFSNLGKFITDRINLRESLFRFINRML